VLPAKRRVNVPSPAKHGGGGFFVVPSSLFFKERQYRQYGSGVSQSRNGELKNGEGRKRKPLLENMNDS